MGATYRSARFGEVTAASLVPNREVRLYATCQLTQGAAVGETTQQRVGRQGSG